MTRPRTLEQAATVREIAEALGTSRATVYRALHDADHGGSTEEPARAQATDPVPSSSRRAALTRGLRSGSESIPRVE